ncbi:MAG: glycosyltransferase [Candidatus Korobacteraceae bacterium]
MRSICFLITSLDPVGGAETQVASLAKGLQGRGWKITVISMLPEGDRLAAELRACGVRVTTLAMKKGKADPRAIWRLAKILRVLKPDVLHAHMVKANLLARVIRLFVSVPVVISTAHSICEGGRLLDLAYRLTDGLGDVTTNVCQAAAHRYIRGGLVPEKRLRVVSNGIDTVRFSPDHSCREELRKVLDIGDKFVWLAIGGLREVKDYPNLLRAFAHFRRATLLIAGEGELRPQLERLAAELQITGRVRFLGFRQDCSELLNAADGYVLSSLWEGLPLVLLEAAATALPVVASDVGGTSEIVMDGKTGFLVPAANSCALRNAMQAVMELPEFERSQMGLAGREYVLSRYSMAQIISKWESLYRDFLGKRMIAPSCAADSAVNDIPAN